LATYRVGRRGRSLNVHNAAFTQLVPLAQGDNTVFNMRSTLTPLTAVYGPSFLL